MEMNDCQKGETTFLWHYENPTMLFKLSQQIKRNTETTLPWPMPPNYELFWKWLLNIRAFSRIASTLIRRLPAFVQCSHLKHVTGPDCSLWTLILMRKMDFTKHRYSRRTKRNKDSELTRAVEAGGDSIQEGVLRCEQPLSAGHLGVGPGLPGTVLEPAPDCWMRTKADLRHAIPGYHRD